MRIFDEIKPNGSFYWKIKWKRWFLLSFLCFYTTPLNLPHQRYLTSPCSVTVCEPIKPLGHTGLHRFTLTFVPVSTENVSRVDRSHTSKGTGHVSTITRRSLYIFTLFNSWDVIYIGDLAIFVDSFFIINSINIALWASTSKNGITTSRRVFGYSRDSQFSAHQSSELCCRPGWSVSAR